MTIKRVGVIGSGIMGSGIAEVVAANGFEVVLRSRSASGAEAALSSVTRSLTRQVEKGKLLTSDRDSTLARVIPVTDLAELADCDLVIESVTEELAVKQALFAELDRVVGEHAILVTNTSSLAVVEIAMQTQHPERVCGIHFFNPAPMMPLVEIVRAITTSDATIAAATEFATSCGRSSVVVRDEAGFIVNRLLFPYLNNAVKLLESGIASRDHIDSAMKGACSFPLGPLELLDLVGLDTSLSIIDVLHAEFGDANYSAAPLIRRMVGAQMLGRKTGQGFYEYPRKSSAPQPS